jgi:predicted DNA-binding transcriptional regulator AlpA
MATEQDAELITAKEAMKMTGILNSSTMYRAIKAGKFPKPVKIGPQSTRFLKSEIFDYVRRLVAERDGGTP